VAEALQVIFVSKNFVNRQQKRAWAASAGRGRPQAAAGGPMPAPGSAQADRAHYSRRS